MDDGKNNTIAFYCFMILVSASFAVYASEHEQIPAVLQPAVKKFQYEAEQNIHNIRHYACQPVKVAAFVDSFLDHDVRVFLKRVGNCMSAVPREDQQVAIEQVAYVVLDKVFDQHLEALNKERHRETILRVQAVRPFFAAGQKSDSRLINGVRTIAGMRLKALFTPDEATDLMVYLLRVHDGFKIGKSLSEFINKAVCQLQQSKLLTAEEVEGMWHHAKVSLVKQQEQEESLARRKQLENNIALAQLWAEEDDYDPSKF